MRYLVMVLPESFKIKKEFLVLSPGSPRFETEICLTFINAFRFFNMRFFIRFENMGLCIVINYHKLYLGDAFHEIGAKGLPLIG